jgi:hypothetical protein
MSYKNPLLRKNPPPLTHQQSFASVRQFMPNEKSSSRFSIRQKKVNEKLANKAPEEMEENSLKRIPSQRKIGMSQQQKLVPQYSERKSKSVTGAISNNSATALNEINGKKDGGGEGSSEKRKFSLTIISQKAKKSMQHKLSELARNEHLTAAKKAMGIDNQGKLFNPFYNLLFSHAYALHWH